jgi:hypothetical protein
MVDQLYCPVLTIRFLKVEQNLLLFFCQLSTKHSTDMAALSDRVHEHVESGPMWIYMVIPDCDNRFINILTVTGSTDPGFTDMLKEQIAELAEMLLSPPELGVFEDVISHNVWRKLKDVICSTRRIFSSQRTGTIPRHRQKAGASSPADEARVARGHKTISIIRHVTEATRPGWHRKRLVQSWRENVSPELSGFPLHQ